MDEIDRSPCGFKPGRPRRGTEPERLDVLIQAATRIFLKQGYGFASIDKIAHEAGVSTRTIYQRFKNKAELMVAVVNRLMDRDMAQMFERQEIDHMEPFAALFLIAQTVVNRLCDADSAALFRIIATEAQHFPELAAQVRRTSRMRLQNKLSAYFKRQTERGVFALADPDGAAALFFHLVASPMEDCLLYEAEGAIGKVDWPRHITGAIHIFLYGATPRPGGQGIAP
jgi:AcrR family transcriptional regulator